MRDVALIDEQRQPKRRRQQHEADDQGDAEGHADAGGHEVLGVDGELWLGVTHWRKQDSGSVQGSARGRVIFSLVPSSVVFPAEQLVEGSLADGVVA